MPVPKTGLTTAPNLFFFEHFLEHFDLVLGCLLHETSWTWPLQVLLKQGASQDESRDQIHEE